MKLGLKLLFAALACVATTLIAVPALATDETSLDTAYRLQSQHLQARVRPSKVQVQELNALFHTRKESERHLRRQMLTTFTPEQRLHARELWQQFDRGRRVTLEERRALRAKVGVTPQQEAQFFAYEEKLQVHRALTTYLASQILQPQQRQLAKDVTFVL